MTLSSQNGPEILPRNVVRIMHIHVIISDSSIDKTE